jgi:hypothetical protein
MEYNVAVLKIQKIFRFKKCLKSLIHFRKMNLKKLSKNLSFDEFRKIIMKKDIINSSSYFISCLEKFKKKLDINPKILITSYLISGFSDDLLGPLKDRHPSDNMILNLSINLVESLETNDINTIWSLLKDFKQYFDIWSKGDKNRTIENLIISYHYRTEHIDKIKSGEINNKSTDSQQKEMILELESQRNEIIKNIKALDKNFDIEYLKTNSKTLFDSIQKAWHTMSVNITNTMKKAYYDKLVMDVNDGNLLSCFNLIKEIGERLLILCPGPKKESFKNKFNEDNIRELLSEPVFNPELKKFILLLVDFILVMDAPVNDENNKLWKSQVINNMNNNFAVNFPKILIEIQEHIDTIYDLIIQLNNQKSN